jgi:hypothetical protein
MMHSPGNRLAMELEYAKAAAGTEHKDIIENFTMLMVFIRLG